MGKALSFKHRFHSLETNEIFKGDYTRNPAVVEPPPRAQVCIYIYINTQSSTSFIVACQDRLGTNEKRSFAKTGSGQNVLLGRRK
jgi:hypothetical protein